jgi:hypothetical protein
MRERCRILRIMAQPMSGIEAKVLRGFEHLDEFEAKAGSFLDDDVYEIVHEIDPDSGMHVGVFHIRKETPLLLSIIAGEAIGQFRSALDHLLKRLVRLDHPSVTQAPNFPIYPKQIWQPAGGGPGVREKYRPLLRDEHMAILDGLHSKTDGLGPTFPGGPFDRSALAVIQWFTNVDKHELVHPVFVAPSRIMFHGHPNVSAYIGVLAPPYILDEGAKLYLVTFVNEAEMEVPLDIEVELTLGPQPMVRIGAETMRAFGLRVQVLIQAFFEVTPELWPRRPERP